MGLSQLLELQLRRSWECATAAMMVVPAVQAAWAGRCLLGLLQGINLLRHLAHQAQAGRVVHTSGPAWTCLMLDSLH